MTMREKLELLERRRAESERGPERIAQQHKKGKLTARERLDLLLDEGSFVELDRFVTHRCTDFGMAEQRSSATASSPATADRRPARLRLLQDFTVFGGSLSETHAEKICKIMDLALKNGAPVIGLNDSGGARIQEGVAPWAATPRSSGATRRPPASSRRSPRSSGPARAARCTRPAITDFIYMVRDVVHVHHRPDVVKTVTHEDVTRKNSAARQVHGGAFGRAHTSRSR
jgi:propionyl-CoA carboxylase beta chain